VVRQANIFYKLTRENEDSATELLCNLLKIKFFRDICLEYFGISENIYENVQSDDIITHHYLEDAGIPDICINYNESLIFIENKIRNSTKLQNSQITSYAEKVAKSKNGSYIFLIPSAYVHKNEIEEVKKEYSSVIRIINWEDFLSYLSKLEIEKCSLTIKESLEYLQDLILGIPKDLTLTNYEVALMYNPKDIYNVLSLLEKNRKLIEKVNDAVLEELKVKHGDKITFGSEYSGYATMDGLGIFLKYKYRDCIYWGLSLNMREKKNGDYVYSLAMKIEPLKNNFREEIDEKRFLYYDEGDWIFVQIDRKLFFDESQEENLKKRVIEIIEDVFLKSCKE